MTGYKYILTACVFVLIMSAVVQAETPKIASAPLRVDLSEVDKFWFQAISFLYDGELLEANLKLEELSQTKMKIGLMNLPTQAEILIKEAYKLKKQGQLKEAVKLLRSAQQLAPNFAKVYFALARFRLAQNFTDVYGAAQDFWRGLLLKFKDINTIVFYVNNGLSILFLTFALTILVFLIFSFGYYRRVIVHHLTEVSPVPIPISVAHILGWVLIGGITLILGVFWGMLFLAFLLMWHLEPASKRVLQGVLGFGALTAVLLIMISITFSVSGGDYFQALRDLAYGNYSKRTVASLQEHLQSDPNDPYAIFGLAYIAKNTGDIQEAIDAYEMITSSYPDRAAVQNNLGNLYQIQYRETNDPALYQKANDAYRSAIGFSGRMFEPRYNIAQLLLLDFKQSGDAGQQLETARKFDEERFSFYSKYLESKIFSIDALFSTTALIQKLYDQRTLNIGLGLAEDIWTSGSRFKNPWYFSIASGVLFILTLVFGGKKEVRKRQVRYCQMCGDPYTVKRKKKDEMQSNFCTQCMYIFKKKTHTDPKKRQQKIQQIQLRQKIRRIFAIAASLLFPGSGQIYFGDILKGLLFAFVFYAAVTIYVLKIHTRVLLDAGGGRVSFLITLAVVALLGIGTYLFNVYDILRLSPKNQ